MTYRINIVLYRIVYNARMKQSPALAAFAMHIPFGDNFRDLIEGRSKQDSTVIDTDQV